MELTREGKGWNLHLSDDEFMHLWADCVTARNACLGQSAFIDLVDQAQSEVLFDYRDVRAAGEPIKSISCKEED